MGSVKTAATQPWTAMLTKDVVTLLKLAKLAIGDHVTVLVSSSQNLGVESRNP
jgi:hypothetical protein